jgi:hypothetical protein
MNASQDSDNIIGMQSPSLQIPPVEAGIRAGETRNLAFPCS